MRFRKKAGLLATSLLLICTNSGADTVSLPLTDDAYINRNNPNLNLGADENMFVHYWGGKYGLVRFDAASIAGQAVNGATLNLYLNDIANNGIIRVYAITSSWSESTVTWNNQPPNEGIEVAVVELSTSDEGSVISIDVIDVVERWADGSLADAGFLIYTDDSIKAYFDAKEKPGGTPATLEVDTGLAAFSGEAIVLDLSDHENCTIDEPGFYVLNRSWLRSEYLEPQNMACWEILITASITLDFRGFKIFLHTEVDGNDVINIEGESVSVTLRNGTVNHSDSIGARNGARVTIEKMYVRGAVSLGEDAKVINSVLSGAPFDATLAVGSNSVVTGSQIGGGGFPPCIWIAGTSVTIQDSIFHCGDGGLSIFASDSTFAGNEVIPTGRNDASLSIQGDRNIISWNVLDSISVQGTGNVVESNISRAGDITFSQAGNFYGNNRIKGSFNGTAGQTDWGGNVSY
jgi:hypothetical protein